MSAKTKAKKRERDRAKSVVSLIVGDDTNYEIQLTCQFPKSRSDGSFFFAEQKSATLFYNEVQALFDRFVKQGWATRRSRFYSRP